MGGGQTLDNYVTIVNGVLIGQRDTKKRGDKDQHVKSLEIGSQSQEYPIRLL